MIWLALAALRARSVLSGALAWFGRNPALGALCGAVVALLLAWHVISVDRATIARLTADKAHMMAAQVEAGRMAAEALHHEEAVYQAKASEADHVYHDQIAAAVAATDAYIASHRVRPSPVGGASGSAIASASGGGAQGSDGPGSAPDMVAVTAADIQVCTVNTERLEAVRDWALGLSMQQRP